MVLLWLLACVGAGLVIRNTPGWDDVDRGTMYGNNLNAPDRDLPTATPWWIMLTSPPISPPQTSKLVLNHKQVSLQLNFYFSIPP